MPRTKKDAEIEARKFLKIHPQNHVIIVDHTSFMPRKSDLRYNFNFIPKKSTERSKIYYVKETRTELHARDGHPSMIWKKIRR